MGYILYSVSLLFVVSATAAYVYRQAWLPTFYSILDYFLDRLPEPLYSRIPSSFHDDVEAGLHSSAFDLSTNIGAGDSRSGLDDMQRRQVLRIMRRRGVDFDEARRIWMEDKFKREGIGADGLPRDPKFVSFS